MFVIMSYFLQLKAIMFGFFFEYFCHGVYLLKSVCRVEVEVSSVNRFKKKCLCKEMGPPS